MALVKNVWYTKRKKRNNTQLQLVIFLWKINESKKNVLFGWSYGVIEPSLSIAIAPEGNTNEKLWFLWRHVKIKKMQIVYY